MSGLACSDPDVLEALDSMLENGKRSDVIGVYKKTDGTVCGSAVNRDMYRALMDHTAEKAARIGQSMVEGNVSISPVQSKNRAACDYCEYKSLCGFDEKNGNKIKRLKKLSSDEVWDRVLSVRRDDKKDQ